MTGVPKVRNIAAQIVLKALQAAGIAAAPLLKEAGIPQSQIEQDGGWLPYISHARLLELAAKALDDPFLGLRLVKRIDPRDLGAFGYVGLSSRTFGDALLNLKNYAKVQTEAWSIGISKDDETASITFSPARPEFSSYRQATEVVVGGLIHIYQRFLGRPLSPVRISFLHAPPKTLEGYEQLLACPVSFRQKRCEVVLYRMALDLPIGTADDKLLKILKQHCEEVLAKPRSSRSDLVVQVRQATSDLLPSGRAKASLVAREIGMTERTLHRRLADEGSSFSDILDNLRHELAVKYIQEETLNFKRIAFLLGYADQSAFSVAFKRWTGQTPKELKGSGTPILRLSP